MAAKIPLTDTICRKCGLDKPIDHFGIDRKYKRGYGTTCKACIAKYASHRYWNGYRTRQLELCRRWYHQHADERTEYNRQYRAQKKLKLPLTIEQIIANELAAIIIVSEAREHTNDEWLCLARHIIETYQCAMAKY
jgi:hypothetical protein